MSKMSQWYLENVPESFTPQDYVDEANELEAKDIEEELFTEEF